MSEHRNTTSAYYSAFAHYLTTGDSSSLSNFMEGGQEEAILAVYRNGFYKASVEALAANYPITAKLLTEPLFQKIAKRFVELTPPCGGTLVGYGSEFPQWLSSAEELKDLNLPPLISDIATLDAGWLKSLNSAEDKSLLTANDVMALSEQGVDPSNSIVSFNPSIQLCTMSFNSFDLWQMIKRDGSIPNQYELKSQNSVVMFWRLEGQVFGKALTGSEHLFFENENSEPFQLGEQIAKTLSAFPDTDVTELFSQCLQQQLLVLNEPKPN